MAWNDPPPPPKQGVWEHWSYGAEIQGWSLRCGAMFFADVRRVGAGGDYYGMLNSWPMGHDPDPRVLMARIDRAIVVRVRQMTGPYRMVLARAKTHAAAEGPTEFQARKDLAKATAPPGATASR